MELSADSEFMAKVKRAKCPKCHKQRLLPGPFYKRGHLRCQNCGKETEVKAP